MEFQFHPADRPLRSIVGLATLLLLISLHVAGQRNNLSFSSDFEGTSPFAIWPTVVGRITQSSTFSREGGFSARVEVVKGDPMIAAGARSEMNLEEIPTVPAEQWFGMSYYIPTTWVVDADKLTDVLAQWHSASGNPPIAFGINVNSWYVQFSNPGNSGILPLGTVNKGAWTDVVFHMKWSSTATGVVEIWINGVKVETYNAANFPKETPGPFFKCGCYKWPWNTGSGELNGVGSLTTDRLLYLDAVRVGTSSATYADVAPGAMAGGPAITLTATQSITLPASSINLSASATDLLSVISTKSWTQVSGPTNANFAPATALTTTVSGLVAGTYVFRLTITDLLGLTATATVTVTVNPAVKRPPAANAGAFQTITLPTNFATLNGSASNDPDGSIVSYAWSKLSGPASDNIISPATAITQVSNLQSGRYTYQLSVTDNSGLTSTDTVSIFVNAATNQSPVANAGASQTITLQNGSVALDGGASSDPDGTLTGYAWKLLSGPSPVNINNASGASTTASFSAAGKYVFQLTVIDNGGLSGNAQVSVIVYDASIQNPPPVADAGPDQTVMLPTNTITLDGSASSASSGPISNYKWIKISGPSEASLNNSGQAVATVTNAPAGVYVYQLTVTDASSSTDASTVTITVSAASNQLPVANAGPGKTIILPANTVTLDGTNSADPDGSIANYSWSKLSGPSGSSFDDAGSSQPQVSGLSAGTFIFQLTVIDNNGGSSTAQVKIIVQAQVIQDQRPVANAGGNQTVYLPATSVLLDGSGSSDPDGNIMQYRWTVLSGPGQGTDISSGSDATTTVNGLDAGTYSYQLTVTDDDALTATDTVTIKIAAADDQLPVANAGQEKTILLPVTTVSLDGSQSTAPGGAIDQYAWSEVSGPSDASINNASSSLATLQDLQAGVYYFQLSITDNNGNQSSDTVKVTVQSRMNQPPIANAGAGQTLTLPTNSAILDGTGSLDPDGTLAYSWQKISGPNGETISNAGAGSTTVSHLAAGTYLFQLTVTDNGGLQSSDVVTINILNASNQLPVANAGSNRVVNLPVTSVGLDGSGSSDADGTVDQYSWSQVSGPSAATFNNAGAPKPVVSGLQAGNYSFQLVVTDNSGGTSVANVDVDVRGAAVIPPPVANAGYRQSITLPTNSTTLNGSASTAVNGAITYAWSQYNGPDQSTLTNAGNSIASITNLKQGTYVYVLKVLRDDGQSATDTVSIVVSPAANRLPQANAGSAITINLPLNSVTLNGSLSSDADGSIVSYAWQQLSGQPGAVFNNSNNASPLVSGLTAGEYIFQLSVTDDAGAMNSAQVKVIVVAMPNQLPVANAGDDQVITLPVSNIFLDGSNSIDPDGSIVSYSWTKISGSGGTISGASTSKPTVSGLTVGTYVYQLTVTDNNGAIASDNISVLVNPVANELPVANAGSNQVIALPTTTVTLDGSGSMDPDGTIAAYSWTKFSGTGGAISNAATSIATATGLQAGTYTFMLTVTDNNGGIATDTVHVLVNAAPNQPPVANAGIDQTITLPVSTVILDGSASSDPDGTIATYNWVRTSGLGGTISNAAIAKPTVTGLTEGSYTYTLTVTDNKGSTATDVVIITVNPSTNQTPVANAGTDQTITLPTNSVALDGSKSADPDGSIATYSWVKAVGTGGTISNAAIAKPTVSGLTSGTYVFSLTVTDNKGATSTDNVTIIVNAANLAPVASAGTDQNITLPTNSVILDGSLSTDADGTIASYSWVRTSGTGGTISNAAIAKPTVSGLTAGSYTYTLTVTDNKGATATDNVIITVSAANKAPVANAGTDQSITLPTSSVILDGSLSTDADGTIASYAWVKTSGTGGTISNTAIAKPTVTGLSAGSYTYTLTVTDNKGATSTDNVVITVNAAVNQAPVANAGTDQTITLPASSVVLDGTGSTDPDGTIASYAWVKVSGTGGTLSSSTIAKPTLSGLTTGSYTYKLTVTDNKGATATDNVIITVSAANQAPVANAGTDQTITLPTNSVILDGSKSTDADGTIASYAWVKVTGTGGTISSTTISKPTVTGLTAGSYTYKLTVTDNKGATSTDNVIITVSAANQAPVANAGTDQTITLPTSSVVLDGSKSTDADGTIASYAWVKVTGTGGTLSSTTISKPTVTGLTAGSYSYKLTVTDNKGATSTDNVTITVNAASNQPPVANAGTDQSITLPISSAVLDGSKSTDPDGTISSYAWVKVSGTGGTISNSAISKPTVTGLTAGSYTYKLTVTDNKGATATDNVIITVSTANKAPVANAGTDQTIRLPTSSVILDGSKSTDADGTIAAYAWVKISGTGGTISNAAIAKPTVSSLRSGTYVYQLTVTDNKGATSTDQVTIIVRSASGNETPDVINIAAVTDSVSNDINTRDSAKSTLTAVVQPELPDALLLYPNPAESKIHLRVSAAATGNMKVNIFDMTGRILVSYEMQKTLTVYDQLIDIARLAHGTYAVEVLIGKSTRLHGMLVKQ